MILLIQHQHTSYKCCCSCTAHKVRLVSHLDERSVRNTNEKEIEQAKKGRKQIVTRKAKAKRKSHGIRFYYITDFNSIFSFCPPLIGTTYCTLSFFGCSFYRRCCIHKFGSMPSNIKYVASTQVNRRKRRSDGELSFYHQSFLCCALFCSVLAILLLLSSTSFELCCKHFP